MTLARLTLETGREIDLSEVHMESTYGGLLEGYPSALLNDAIVESLAGRASRLLPGGPVHTIDPQRTQPLDEVSTVWAFGPLETLPAVIVMGRFQSLPVDREADPVLNYSRLVVVWFQDEPTLPETGQAPSVLLRLNWDLVAQDDEV